MNRIKEFFEEGSVTHMKKDTEWEKLEEDIERKRLDGKV
jgi:hypothetical protein